jgi:hypothetical protein
MLYANILDALDDGYHYFLQGITGNYTHSMWKNKRAAEAALEIVNNNPRRNFFTPLVLISHQDL